MRDFLCYTENHETWGAAASYAARLAAARGGRLTGAYICPSPLAAMPPVISPDLVSLLLDSTRALEHAAAAAAPAFLSWAAGEGVTDAQWQVAEGSPPEVLAHIGARHDALVIARGEGAWTTPTALGHIALTCGLPCFVVPEGSDFAAPHACIAIAWNGVREGMRALHAALPLLATAARVVLLRGALRDPLMESAWQPPFDIAEYFRRHGLSAETQLIDDDAHAGEALLAACGNVGADLLVMGAYGRSRLREWVFGGATRHVLQHANLPLLLRH